MNNTTFDISHKYIAATAIPPVMRKRTDNIVVHHAAFKYKLSDACRSIYVYHSGKWPKYGRIGYHEILQEENDFTVSRYLVNPSLMQGANVAEMNHVCYGICAATNFGNMLPAEKWFNALVYAVSKAKLMFPNAQVVGHREIAQPGFETICPGSQWFEWKQRLLDAVQGPLPPVIMHRVIGVRPSCSFAAFSQFLMSRNAPIEPIVMQRVYMMCEWLDIDPAFLVALWWHEQGGLGTYIGDTPLGNLSFNPLNIKAYGRWPIAYKPGTMVQFNRYESWQLGLLQSLLHLKQFYGARGLLTVEDIIPVFAPETDHNLPSAYIAAVTAIITALRGT